MKVLTAGSIILIWVGSSFIQEKVYTFFTVLRPDNNSVVQGISNVKSAFFLIHRNADITMLHRDKAENCKFLPYLLKYSSQLNTIQLSQPLLGSAKGYSPKLAGDTKKFNHLT